MRLNMLASMTIISMVTLTTTLVSSKPVSVKIRPQADGVAFVNINFYNDTFMKFYDCIVKSLLRKCTVVLGYDQGRPYNNDDRYVLSVVADNQVALSSGPVYSSCKFDRPSERLICQNYINSPCNPTTCQYFRPSGLSCDTKCAQILWMPEGELVYNNITDNIEDCNNICTQTTVTVIRSTGSFITALSSKSAASDVTTNGLLSSSHVTDGDDDKQDNNNVPVIAGLVCGVGVLCIVIVIGIILWRRKRFNGRKRTESKNNTINSVLTYEPDTTGHGKAHILLGSTIQRNAHLSQTPDIISTISHTESGNENSADPDDGYYRIEHDYNRNRYQNVQDKYPEQVSGVTASKEQDIQDTDYDYSGNEDHCILDTASVMGPDGYTTANDITSVTDDYSLAQCEQSGTPDASSQQNNVYSRLGEKVTNINNPYNILLKPTEDPKSRKPPPNPALRKQSVDNDDYNDVEIVKDATSAELTETSQKTVQNRNPSESWADKYNKSTDNFPEYTAEKKNKRSATISSDSNLES